MDDREKLNRVIQFIVEAFLLCISQMQPHSLSKFFATLVAADDLWSLQAQLGHEYSELSLGAIMTVLDKAEEVLSRILETLPPSQGRSPKAVGIEEVRKYVTKLLDMKGKLVKVVVIYGQGGIGKTTLASTVFSNLDLTNYKHCRVNMQQNSSKDDLKLLQQQILEDLFFHKLNLRILNEGQEQLSTCFTEHSSELVFIFIENALKQTDLERLMPIHALASFLAKSVILLTTRNLNETRILLQQGVERCPYLISCLPQQKARELLCELALDIAHASFDPIIDISGLLKICQGIPLVLTMKGPKLCEHAKSVKACKDVVLKSH